MHSFTVKAALAAFVLSTSLAGAYAASSNATSSNAGHSNAASSSHGTSPGLGGISDPGLSLGLGLGAGVGRGFDDPTNGREAPFETIYNSPGYADQMYVMPEQTRRAAMTNPSTSTTRHPHQRLAHVMGQLGATNHRIAVDSKRGYLTASETARVRHEERAIRNAATRTADANGGVLPRRSYERLQADIQGLNRQIHHYATA